MLPQNGNTAQNCFQNTVEHCVAAVLWSRYAEVSGFLVFLRGGACLSTGPATWLLLDGGISFNLAYARQNLRCSVVHWICGCGWWKLAQCIHINYEKHTHIYAGLTTWTVRHTHRHSYTSFCGFIPRMFWSETSCMYSVDCLQVGHWVWHWQQSGNRSCDFWEKWFPPAICLVAKHRW